MEEICRATGMAWWRWCKYYFAGFDFWDLLSPLQKLCIVDCPSQLRLQESVMFLSSFTRVLCFLLVLYVCTSLLSACALFNSTERRHALLSSSCRSTKERQKASAKSWQLELRASAEGKVSVAWSISQATPRSTRYYKGLKLLKNSRRIERVQITSNYKWASWNLLRPGLSSCSEKLHSMTSSQPENSANHLQPRLRTYCFSKCMHLANRIGWSVSSPFKHV